MDKELKDFCTVCANIGIPEDIVFDLAARFIRKKPLIRQEVFECKFQMAWEAAYEAVEPHLHFARE